MVWVVAALRTELLFVRGRTVAVGVGERARARLASQLEEKRPAGALVVGFCGGLRADALPGTLILAETLTEEDAVVSVDERLLEKARTALAGAVVGGVVTVDRAIGPAGKAGLGLDAVAVNMESAYLAAELSGRGIPFLVMRVVLDALWEDVSLGPRVRWCRRAILGALSLSRAAAALRPVLEGTR